MAVDLQIKKGDTRDWSFTLSDADGDAVNLSSARVWFRLMTNEWSSSTYFDRDTSGSNSESDITIGTPASDGGVTITPSASDWVDISDNYGIYVGEFKVSDSNEDIFFTQDVTIDIQEALF